MRANDAYRGFVSDTFSFTMFQELLASTVDLPVGTYLHRPTSVHTFPEDEAAIQKILAARHATAPLVSTRMPPIRHEQFWEHLPAFWAAHDRSRREADWSLLKEVGEVDDPWWHWVIDMLTNHHTALERGDT